MKTHHFNKGGLVLWLFVLWLDHGGRAAEVCSILSPRLEALQLDAVRCRHVWLVLFCLAITTLLPLFLWTQRNVDHGKCDTIFVY